MRVLYFPVMDTGGASKSFMEFVSNLHMNNQVEPIIIVKNKGTIYNYAIKNKFEVHVVDFDDFYLCSGSTTIKKIAKYFLRPYFKIKYLLKNIKAIKKIEKDINFSKIDLIHTNLNRCDLGIKLSKKYNIPNILHIREFGELDYECFSLRKNYIRYFNENVTKFIAISNAVSDYWVSKGLNKNKIQVIYNGVNEKQFIYNKKEKQEKIKIAFSGTIVPIKGQIQAIKAISLLNADIKNKIELHLFGTVKNDYYKVLNKFIVTNNLENIVIFEGQTNNLNEILPTYDIGLTCSQSEAFGRITIEYMMSKLCVIASDTGANSELIENNKTGLLYQYNNIEDLSKKLELIIKDEKFRKKIANNGYIDSINKFTSLNNSDNIIKLYIKVK